MVTQVNRMVMLVHREFNIFSRIDANIGLELVYFEAGDSSGTDRKGPLR